VSQQPFAIQNSTLSADALGAYILAEYPFAAPLSCRFYRKGICDTYLVATSHTTCYLKVYRAGRRSEQDVSEEVRLLNHLADHGIRVARPVARCDGGYLNLLVAPEGMRCAVLFHAAPGNAWDESNPRQTRAFGEVVARVHQCADTLPGEYRRAHLDTAHLLDENLAAIAPFMASHGAERADLRLIEQIADDCARRITESLSTTEPVYGICHGDLHGGDVRYDGGNQPTLFDFDSSGCGWRAVDIGVFLASDEWMNTSEEKESERQLKLATFLEGYAAVRSLSEEELAIVQLSPAVRHIFLMGHVLRYTRTTEGEHWANQGFIDWHMAWFRHWAEKHGG